MIKEFVGVSIMNMMGTDNCGYYNCGYCKHETKGILTVVGKVCFSNEGQYKKATECMRNLYSEGKEYVNVPDDYENIRNNLNQVKNGKWIKGE